MKKRWIQTKNRTSDTCLLFFIYGWKKYSLPTFKRQTVLLWDCIVLVMSVTYLFVKSAKGTSAGCSCYRHFYSEAYNFKRKRGDAIGDYYINVLHLKCADRPSAVKITVV